MKELPELEPKPVLRLHFNEISHPATTTFLTLIDCVRLLPNAIDNVLRYIYAPYASSQAPPTRSVTLILRPMDGVAYTTGLELDKWHKEIHVNLKYVEIFANEPLRCRDEIIGVVTHEMVHCYQYNCLGTAPGGLIEGIADYVRLKAGLAPPHWKGPKGELGDRWDAGYQRTAYFLDWLESEYGPGTVARINESMRCAKYDEEAFWTGLFGKHHDIGVLFKRFRDSLEDEEVVKSAVSDDGVLVELDEPEKRAVRGKRDTAEDGTLLW